MMMIQMETISLGYIDNPKAPASAAEWSFYADIQEQANSCASAHTWTRTLMRAGAADDRPHWHRLPVVSSSAGP